MEIKSINNAHFSIPVRLNEHEQNYLQTMSRNGLSLTVYSDNKGEFTYTLRNRFYTNNSDFSKYESKIGTQGLHKLIEKGYLVCVVQANHTFLLKPNPGILSFLQKQHEPSKDKSFTLSYGGTIFTFTYLKDLTPSDIQVLNKKTQQVGLRTVYAETVAVKHGINTQGLYKMVLDDKKEGLYAIFSKSGWVKQVFPKGLGDDLTKIDDLKVVISDDLVQINSYKYATSYCYNAKLPIYTLSGSLEKIKEIKKLAKQRNTKVRGYAGIERKLTQRQENYDKLVPVYTKLYTDLIKIARQIEKEGLYVGGVANNPRLKKLNDKRTEIDQLLRQKSFIETVALNRKLDKALMDVNNYSKIYLD